jgi:hypothetical protein
MASDRSEKKVNDNIEENCSNEEDKGLWESEIECELAEKVQMERKKKTGIRKTHRGSGGERYQR